MNANKSSLGKRSDRLWTSCCSIRPSRGAALLEGLGSLRAILSTVFVGCLLSLATTPVMAGPPCQAISGLDRYILNSHGVVVGDMHGTAEAPAFVSAVACNLLRADRAVLLALEYPACEQHFVEDFVQAREDDPRRALLASPFWTRPTQDGRTSRAMLALLDWVRQEIAGGARIRVIAFDFCPKQSASGAASFDARDEAMAVRLHQELSTLSPGEVPVIFTGNVHARKTKGLPFLNAPPGSEAAQPLGYRIKDLGFLHMNIAYSGGTAWNCFESACGVHGSTGSPAPAVTSFLIRPSADPAYDVEYFVGPLTASPPAVPGALGK
jgi:hypothetical protein